MSLLWLMVTIALADDVVAVPAGQTTKVTGPSVCMSETRFTRFLVAEESLPLCRERLDKITDLSIRTTEQSLAALATVDQQLLDDAALITALQADLVLVTAQRDKALERTSRLRSQRNASTGVALGFLAASVAAVALVLN